MALVALKKVLTGAAILTGGGYGGALLYGSRDEEGRTVLGEVLPGYARSYEGLQRLLEISNLVRAKLRGIASGNRPTKAAHPLMEFREPEPLVLAKPKGSAMATSDDILSEQRIEEAYRRKFERELEIFKLKQSAMFEQELHAAIEQEHHKASEKIAELTTRAESLDSRIDRLQERLLGAERAYATWLDLECALALMSSSRFVASPAETVKQTVELLQMSNPHKELAGIYHSVLASMRSSPHGKLSIDYFTREYNSLLPWAERYASSDRKVGLLSFFLPHRSLLSILSGRSAEEEHTRAVLHQVRASLQRGDLGQALSLANRVAGWPRVFLKDWINDCRRYLEIQQGLNIIKAHMLATRLCSQN